MLLANRRWPSWRPLAPLLLILGLVIAAILLLSTGLWVPFAFMVGAWSATLITIGLQTRSILAALAGAIMHVSYGLGEIAGLLLRQRPESPQGFP
jgi:hypothetical protein